MLSGIREWLNGKKAILTAVVGILTALIAWAAGEISTVILVTAVWVALEAIFIRLGVKKAEVGW